LVGQKLEAQQKLPELQSVLAPQLCRQPLTAQA
jgi:hypothetical protein